MPWQLEEESQQQSQEPKRFGNWVLEEEPQEKETPWFYSSEEPWYKNLGRTIVQAPLGIGEATTYGLLTGLWQMLGQGEVLDNEELDHLEEVLKREGVPFDREKYMKAAETALSGVPTVSNIGRKVEEKTGFPIEPKTKLQKLLRLGSTATKLAPQPGTFQGMNTTLPRPVLGGGVAVTSQVAQEAGVPEPIADLLSFGILKQSPKGAGEVSITKTKPSGLTERKFENTKKPTEISQRKLNDINSKVESEFRDISDKIIKDSPIGETAKNLIDDPTYKQQSRELLNEAQEVANNIKGTIPKQEIIDEVTLFKNKNNKGFVKGEYDKSYDKFMDDFANAIEFDPSYGQSVEQYRKNNGELGEYFEPGASKALNRAKRDALLDQNRILAKIIEKKNPELSKVFTEGNARWTKIMDAEAVDSFVNDVFSGDKIDFKNLHDFFDKSGYDRIFKRSLGEEGYKQFEQLIKDMLTSEKPYQMLKIAKSKGFGDLVRLGSHFILNPKLTYAKAAYDVSKRGYRTFLNSMLDDPKLTLQYRKGLDELNKGKFKESEQTFKKIEKEKENSRQGALKKFNEKINPQKTHQSQQVPKIQP